ncbi:hypothetical protein CDL12_30237 [Handroanthus impetiginosus]|uniref:Uncharacterized protein n=1 Tax=Handroanthus impetiginosus TaxID=429701 RepID=A0A2G9FWM8_9LAMI|nr:hypothetical protein CDL12_30237 [Handroanthus impetiginosus]
MIPGPQSQPPKEIVMKSPLNSTPWIFKQNPPAIDTVNGMVGSSLHPSFFAKSMSRKLCVAPLSIRMLSDLPLLLPPLRSSPLNSGNSTREHCVVMESSSSSMPITSEVGVSSNGGILAFLELGWSHPIIAVNMARSSSRDFSVRSELLRASSCIAAWFWSCSLMVSISFRKSWSLVPSAMLMKNCSALMPELIAQKPGS